MDTNDLRKASIAVFLATEESVARDLSNKLRWAADEIDRLHKQLCEDCGLQESSCRCHIPQDLDPHFPRN